MITIFTDRVHRLPRLWSNKELRKIAHLFEGRVINVSAWKDEDKEGDHYKNYFLNSSDYSISNFKAEANGFQDTENEIFLDLTSEIPKNLKKKFDVVFNHTTLEHIYEARLAFANLCEMSKDIVVIVLPFMQQYHAHYGDFWRFSPEAVKNLFAENGFELVYLNSNNHVAASVYLFAVAARNPEKWSKNFPGWTFTCKDSKPILQEPYVGCHAIPNRLYRLWFRVKLILLKLLPKNK